MNKLFLLVIFALASTFTFGQDIKKSEVPAPLKDKIKSLYPDAGKIEWEMEDGMYEASFDDDKRPTSVLINPQALIVRTDIELAKEEWPAFIMNFISSQPGAPMADEVEMCTDIQGLVTYEIEAGDIEYLLSEKGVLLSKKTEKDDNQ